MIKVPFNDLRRIHDPLRKELDSAWKKVVDNSSFILGPEVDKFEDEFAIYNGLKGKENAAGVDSGLSALELSLISLDIGRGDQVITTANTFNATVSAIRFTGAMPILVDIDPQTHLMDIHQIQRKITKKTKAIIPVHLYGQQAKMSDIYNIAVKYDIKIIEDACQAHGSLRYNSPPGSLSNAATFSFYPGKNLGAFGDAGIVISKNQELIEKVKKLRNYGQSKKYYHDGKGFNRRLDGLQAAILRVKLPHLEEWNESRRESAKKLIDRLKDVGDLELPIIEEGNKHTYHLFVIMTNNSSELREYLHERGIETGIHYPVPIHLQPAFKDLGIFNGSFPITERNASRMISLPIFPYMKQDEIDHIVDSIKDFYKK